MRSIAITVLCLVTLAASSCEGGPIFGDDIYSVQFENQTGLPVQLYEIGIRPSSEPMITPLAAGATRFNNWRYPRRNKPTERATVRAETDSGQVIFCKTYSFADVAAVRQRITITQGVNDCS